MSKLIGLYFALVSAHVFGQTHELTREQSQKFLAKHLDPKPGDMINIPEEQIINFGPSDRARGRLFGFITVTPPKGQCFTIMTNVTRQDHEVCRATQIKWFLDDIEPNLGTIQWNIKWKPDQSYVPVRWQTSYRVAKFVGPGKTLGKDQSTRIFIQSCQALKSNDNRSIELKTFSEGTWKIRLPNEEAPIPPAESEAKTAKTAEPPKDSSKPTESGSSPKVEPPSDNWTIATRRGFIMNSSLVYPSKNRPAGGPGSCRYQYDTVMGDYSNGRIECKDGASFAYFYAPLNCISKLKP